VSERFVEVWKSSENREERHYFLKDGQMHGYQIQGAYLFGVNPQFFDDDKINRILAMLDEQ
jgi:hypothetical protein